MYVVASFLCTHCGRSGHVKERYDKLKYAKERHVKFVKLESCQTNREQGPGSCDESVRNDRPVKN